MIATLLTILACATTGVADAQTPRTELVFRSENLAITLEGRTACAEPGVGRSSKMTEAERVEKILKICGANANFKAVEAMVGTSDTRRFYSCMSVSYSGGPVEEIALRCLVAPDSNAMNADLLGQLNTDAANGKGNITMVVGDRGARLAFPRLNLSAAKNVPKPPPALLENPCYSDGKGAPDLVPLPESYNDQSILPVVANAFQRNSDNIVQSANKDSSIDQFADLTGLLTPREQSETASNLHKLGWPKSDKNPSLMYRYRRGPLDPLRSGPLDPLRSSTSGQFTEARLSICASCPPGWRSNGLNDCLKNGESLFWKEKFKCKFGLYRNADLPDTNDCGCEYLCDAVKAEIDRVEGRIQDSSQVSYYSTEKGKIALRNLKSRFAVAKEVFKRDQGLCQKNNKLRTCIYGNYEKALQFVYGLDEEECTDSNRKDTRTAPTSCLAPACHLGSSIVALADDSSLEPCPSWAIRMAVDRIGKNRVNLNQCEPSILDPSEVRQVLSQSGFDCSVYAKPATQPASQ